MCWVLQNENGPEKRRGKKRLKRRINVFKERIVIKLQDEGEDKKLEDGRDLDELTELSYELRNVSVSKGKKKTKKKKKKLTKKDSPKEYEEIGVLTGSGL